MNLFENLQKLNEQDKLLEMANLVGEKCKTDKIDFSFYFSSKENMSHGIRVKIVWNKQKMNSNDTGYLELHGDYKYVPSSGSKKIEESKINQARIFFKKYKALFAAVWEYKIDDPNIIIDYLRNNCDFKDILSEFGNLSEENMMLISHAENIEELEKIIRNNEIFNMND